MSEFRRASEAFAAVQNIRTANDVSSHKGPIRFLLRNFDWDRMRERAVLRTELDALLDRHRCRTQTEFEKLRERGESEGSAKGARSSAKGARTRTRGENENENLPASAGVVVRPQDNEKQHELPPPPASSAEQQQANSEPPGGPAVSDVPPGLLGVGPNSEPPGGPAVSDVSSEGAESSWTLVQYVVSDEDWSLYEDLLARGASTYGRQMAGKIFALADEVQSFDLRVRELLTADSAVLSGRVVSGAAGGEERATAESGSAADAMELDHSPVGTTSGGANAAAPNDGPPEPDLFAYIFVSSNDPEQEKRKREAALQQEQDAEKRRRANEDERLAIAAKQAALEKEVLENQRAEEQRAETDRQAAAEVERAEAEKLRQMVEREDEWVRCVRGEDGAEKLLNQALAELGKLKLKHFKEAVHVLSTLVKALKSEPESNPNVLRHGNAGFRHDFLLAEGSLARIQFLFGLGFFRYERIPTEQLSQAVGRTTGATVPAFLTGEGPFYFLPEPDPLADFEKYAAHEERLGRIEEKLKLLELKLHEISARANLETAAEELLPGLGEVFNSGKA